MLTDIGTMLIQLLALTTFGVFVIEYVGADSPDESGSQNILLILADDLVCYSGTTVTSDPNYVREWVICILLHYTTKNF